MVSLICLLTIAFAPLLSLASPVDMAVKTSVKPHSSSTPHKSSSHYSSHPSSQHSSDHVLITSSPTHGVNVATSTPAKCSPLTVCVDYLNSCHERYGGCYNTCDGPASKFITPPPCPTTTPSPSSTKKPSATTKAALTGKTHDKKHEKDHDKNHDKKHEKKHDKKHEKEHDKKHDKKHEKKLDGCGHME